MLQQSSAPQATQCFELERHEGPYEHWPARTRVLSDGQATGLHVPGYTLLRQYEMTDGYLLITDYDCPYEEATSFILVSKSLKVLSCKTLFVPYGSFCFDSIAWLDAQHARIVFYQDDLWDLTIRNFSIPYLWPRLVIQPAKLSGAAPI